MARTALTPVASTREGASISALTAANVDGNSIVNNGGVLLIVYNGDASSKTITVQTPGKKFGLEIAEVTLAVPAGEYAVFGFFEPEIFNQTDGTVYVDYSAITSVEVVAIQT